MLFRSRKQRRRPAGRLAGFSRIIPGDWEKGWARLVGSAPLAGSCERSQRQHSPVPLAMFAHRQQTRKGTVRLGAIRNRSESSQVVRAGFDPGRIAVTQRVKSCYCASARAGCSGGCRKVVSQRKAPKGEQSEHSHRGGQAVQARPLKTFRQLAA